MERWEATQPSLRGEERGIADDWGPPSEQHRAFLQQNVWPHVGRADAKYGRPPAPRQGRGRGPA
eukprot:5931845-Alexandrium_andersonii.AAC.1